MKDNDNEKRLREIEKELSPEALKKAASILGAGTSTPPASAGGSKKKKNKVLKPSALKSNMTSDKERISNILSNIESAKSLLSNIIKEIEKIDKKEILSQLTEVLATLDNVEKDIKEKSVMLIIPDKNLRRSVSANLKTYGFTDITEYESGKSALKALITKTAEKKVDFILCDINLIDFTVDSFANYIKNDDKINESCPFLKFSKIVLVTKGNAANMESLKKVVDGFLMWPFNINDILRVLKNL